MLDLKRVVLPGLVSGFVLTTVPWAVVRAQTQGPPAPDSVRVRDHNLDAPAVSAARLTGFIKVDGALDDAAWAAAIPATEFIQTEPREGAPASERTEVRFLYDDEALYIGARMQDSKRDVRKRMGRRDAYVEGSDFLYITLDSHHQHLRAYQFAVNPAGVKRDELTSGGGMGDASWDAVWDAVTRVGEDGWTAELRIPFSQFRFANTDEQTWGVQISRRIIRNQEVTVFAFTPKSERGGIHRYGHLRGLKGLRTGKRIEAMPYTVARSEHAAATAGDPYNDGSEQKLGVGLDMKYRVTSSLTMDATVNPDFGQVELDPAVVNLSAFETSFDERRPFFVEGADIFRVDETRIFYSRRVGRPPQGSIPDAQFANRPDASTILAAAKLSGRTARGWEIGLLNALTGREHARYQLATGESGSVLVEPATNYMVGRAKRNMRGGQSVLGVIATATNRADATDELTALLRSSAYVGGLDFVHEFFQRTWSASGFLAMSHVNGSPEALWRTQRSSARYFQRPDADYVELDSGITSMSGYAARLEVGKRAGLHWRGEAAVTASSPGYEVNDAGFQTSVDRLTVGGNITYVQNRPGRVFRDWRISANPRVESNYGREVQQARMNVELNGNLLNYWGGNINLTYGLDAYDDRLTRGGPTAGVPAGRNIGGEIHSDNRKSINGRFRGNYGWNEGGGWEQRLSTNVTLRPSESWTLSLGSSYNRARTAAQYLGALADTFATATYDHRYLFAPIRQSTLSLETRVGFNFTPELSLDIVAQPFVSSGDYGLPMQLRRARVFEFDRFGRDLGTLRDDSTFYTIDPDGAGPALPFTVSKRDFSTRSLRGNAVFRWEWRPGSTLFLVWQQQRAGSAGTGYFVPRRELRELFTAPARNVFLIKVSYWLNP